MTAVWPGSLPKLPVADAPERAVAPRYSFAADAGPPIERPKGTMRMSEIDVRFPMTLRQVETFENWFYDDIARGTASFSITHPRTYAQVTGRIKGGDQPYQIERLGFAKRLVTFTLMVIG